MCKGILFCIWWSGGHLNWPLHLWWFGVIPSANSILVWWYYNVSKSSATWILTSAFHYVSLTISSTWLDKLSTWHWLFIHCDLELNRNGISCHQSSFHSTTKQYCMPPLFLLPLLCAIYCKTKAIITLHDFLSSVSHTLPSLFVLALPPIHSNILLLFWPSVYLVSLKFSRASFLIMCLSYFSWKFSWSFFDSYFLQNFFCHCSMIFSIFLDRTTSQSL